jgi:hypothetical protein
MSKLTITEALQEIKTINKRLAVKRETIMKYAARDARIKDPFEKDGGTVEFIEKEKQSAIDLQKRIVKIRTEISRANLDNELTINDVSLTVAEWLIWRREISEGLKGFLNNLTAALNAVRTKIQQQGGKVVANIAQVSSLDSSAPPELIVNIDEKGLIAERENLEITLGELDGKLSLFNATEVIYLD